MRIDRRDFLSLTSGVAALALSPFEQIAAQQPPTLPAAFSLQVMATNWGFPGSMDAFCEKAKRAGYDGIEVWWPADSKVQQELFDALKKHDLQVGFLAGGSDKDTGRHFDQFRQMLDGAAYQKIKRPLYINCHSGRDYFSATENSRFIDYTDKVSAETGIGIYHETHRGRMLFAAHVTRQFLQKHSSLRLTLDISHWCNVHESLLHDQEETVQLALARVDHIHTRVGHPEGPQVNDPRAPEWENAVKRHLSWWDAVVKHKADNGSNRLTILTEFGPPDYMPTLPYTRQPLGDQWAINEYMMQFLRKRYQSV
ncbi:sugar phosphate isomerase/epimerase family protein [Sediminibacterium soli]|uniref:sugar phosphate isomerase/epimerase family protein n=1 Tax=Sediminibacterium soli TaxID=2698829 RepID=UPI00137B0D83|nr:TIM barrel protein [Sediminibacterium soli]NCI45586.1 sugar phosphate isomerase/epimerase [Sediminibacterium soli]